MAVAMCKYERISLPSRLNVSWLFLFRTSGKGRCDSSDFVSNGALCACNCNWGWGGGVNVTFVVVVVMMIAVVAVRVSVSSMAMTLACDSLHQALPALTRPVPLTFSAPLAVAVLMVWLMWPRWVDYEWQLKLEENRGIYIFACIPRNQQLMHLKAFAVIGMVTPILLTAFAIWRWVTRDCFVDLSCGGVFGSCSCCSWHCCCKLFAGFFMILAICF